ncbi:MerR HTH family regulatory protein [Brevibacterium siliguriense]|uniref:MerR HTH family regulatory protein n=1 Tax=Brevibacterium siliguriense TaxID=1136497 RepID=A0A1H1RKS7_9MICO|nr:MerR family transcriptional regulator [Brevibacterium siliguriense]SDS36272.1 MerR HTH family regulatory protein [Brevibacterium siliguriense]
MRMAELSRRSELSVPTIQCYLREGLLRPGRRTSVNLAVYDQTHLERLRLIRALTTVAGLRLAKVRAVVDAMDRQASEFEAMGVTQDALIGEADGDDAADAGSMEDRIRGVVLRGPLLEALVLLAQQHFAQELTLSEEG